MDKKAIGTFLLGAAAGIALLVSTGAADDVDLQERVNKSKNLTSQDVTALMIPAAIELGVKAEDVQSYSVKRITRTVSAGTDAPAVVTEYGLLTAVVDEQLSGTEYLTKKVSAGDIKVLSGDLSAEK